MPLKHFKCGYYEVDVTENHCLFCKHCRDVFWDYTNGPYAFGCRLTEDNGIFKAYFGAPENCENFEEEEDGE